jgi:hypothetical protein
MQFFQTLFSELKIMLPAKFLVQLTAGSIARGCFQLLPDRTDKMVILLDLKILQLRGFETAQLAIAQFPANSVKSSGNVRFLASPNLSLD